MIKRHGIAQITSICLMTFAIMIAMIFVGRETAFAAVTESFELTSYDMDIVVHKDHSYSIKKKIAVNIPDDISSLSINVPNGNYLVSGITVDVDEYNIEDDGSNKKVTILSPEALKKGKHTYTFSYSINEFNDHNPENDIFYIDVMPPDWAIPVGSITIDLTLPDDFVWDDLQYYAGQFGTQSVANLLSYTVEGNTITMTGEKIPADFGITFNAELPDGYWEGALDNSWTARFAAIVTAVILALIMLLWLVGGRDPKVIPTIEKEPIEELSPADIGFLFGGETRLRDVISILIYLATKGSLKICEYAPKKYRLIKGSEPKQEKRFIRSVYHTLFDDVYEGRSIEMEDLGSKLKNVLYSMQLDIESGYSSKELRACTGLSRIFRFISIAAASAGVAILPALGDMYRYRDRTYGLPAVFGILCAATLIFIVWSFDRRYEFEEKKYNLMMWIGIMLYLIVVASASYKIAAASQSWPLLIIIMALAVASVFFICIMKARGKENAVLVAKLLSLRQFVAGADQKDIGDMSKHNENYYYDILPYAFQFSMLDSWAKKFRWMGVKKADWYSDEISGHAITNAMREKTTIEVARDINTFARTVESEFKNMERGFRLMG